MTQFRCLIGFHTYFPELHMDEDSYVDGYSMVCSHCGKTKPKVIHLIPSEDKGEGL